MPIIKEINIVDRITKAERKLANACVLCGSSVGSTKKHNLTTNGGKISLIFYSECNSCGGGYWQ